MFDEASKQRSASTLWRKVSESWRLLVLFGDNFGSKAKKTADNIRALKGVSFTKERFSRYGGGKQPQGRRYFWGKNAQPTQSLIFNAWAQQNKHQQTGTIDHSKTRSSRFSKNKTGDGGPISQRVDTSGNTTTWFSNFSLVPYFGWHWPYTSRVRTSHSGGQNSTLLKQLVTDYRQRLGSRSDNRLQARAYQYSFPNPHPVTVVQ